MTESMAGKTCVVTGANTGIGFVAARELAKQGAEVWLVGRNPAKVDAAVEVIRASGAPGKVDRLIADLSSQVEVRALADALARRTKRVDVLLNNAGAMFPKLGLSVDGVEQTFALNQLGYYTLTLGILPLLRKAESARVVNVASDAHRAVKSFDLDMFTNTSRYSGWRAYCRSKLANVLFTRALARRLEGTGISANSLHPGVVATDILDNPGPLWWVARRFWSVVALSPDAGARTSLYLATDPSVGKSSGGYYEKCREAVASLVARDNANAEALWRRCEELTGVRMDGSQ